MKKKTHITSVPSSVTRQQHTDKCFSVTRTVDPGYDDGRLTFTLELRLIKSAIIQTKTGYHWINDEKEELNHPEKTSFTQQLKKYKDIFNLMYTK